MTRLLSYILKYLFAANGTTILFWRQRTKRWRYRLDLNEYLNENRKERIFKMIKGLKPITSQRRLLTLFLNRADTDQSGSTLLAYGYMIRYNPILVDLTSNFFVLCSNVTV